MKIFSVFPSLNSLRRGWFFFSREELRILKTRLVGVIFFIFKNNKKITSNCDGGGDGRRLRMTREIRGRMVYVFFLELRKKIERKK